MSTSLFCGLSGVQAHQAYTDVVANNIANTNTVGFKQGRVTFQDTLYRTLRPALPPQSSGAGGTAAVQVGSGVTLASADVLHSQGAFQRTGQPLDLALEGDGMFVVQDQGKIRYTRAGMFSINAVNGIISSSTGAALLGWRAVNSVVDTTGPLEVLQIPLGQAVGAITTTEIELGGNLDAGADVYSAGPPPTGGRHVCSMDVYDSLGVAHTVVIELTKASSVPTITWNWEATVDGAVVGTGSVDFDSSGMAVPPVPPDTISIPLTNGANTPLDVTVRCDGLTQYAGDYTAAVESQDGWPSGTVQSVVVDRDGFATGRLTSGLDVLIGQVAVARFPNVAGTARFGQSMFEETPASGRPVVGPANTGARGAIVSGALELSNVDLTQQFVQLIIAQQAFQASARVITTSNQMMQEVLRLVQ